VGLQKQKYITKKNAKSRQTEGIDLFNAQVDVGLF
jgi:hypothetical protein